jgi:hypothetical protein
MNLEEQKLARNLLLYKLKYKKPKVFKKIQDKENDITLIELLSFLKIEFDKWYAPYIRNTFAKEESDFLLSL